MIVLLVQVTVLPLMMQVSTTLLGAMVVIMCTVWLPIGCWQALFGRCDDPALGFVSAFITMQYSMHIILNACLIVFAFLAFYASLALHIYFGRHCEYSMNGLIKMATLNRD